MRSPRSKALDGVIDQGFDPQGVLPDVLPYNRIHYYSTMLTKEGAMLAITKLSPNRRILDLRLDVANLY